MGVLQEFEAKHFRVVSDGLVVVAYHQGDVRQELSHAAFVMIE
jgi:hypothetical protein